MDSLQIPDPSIPGPSRQPPTNRPVSVQPYTNTSPASPSTQQSSSSRKQRASHTVTSGAQQDDGPTYRDVYSHPAALAYAANHPRRTIPKFGPYLLLQTLGEGEFGKVKLGLHTNWGEEVAVKLIKRHNIDSAVRMSKVEREIEVLRVSPLPFSFSFPLHRLADYVASNLVCNASIGTCVCTFPPGRFSMCARPRRSY